MSYGGNHFVKEECIAVAGERNQVRKRITEKKKKEKVSAFLRKNLSQVSEAYLRLSQTSMIAHFCKNNEWLLAVNYFRKKLHV